LAVGLGRDLLRTRFSFGRDLSRSLLGARDEVIDFTLALFEQHQAFLQ
jgi:hypothetical protein